MFISCSTCSFSQATKIVFEQRAFDFFSDSILKQEFRDSKNVYCSRIVDLKHSTLIPPIGFKNYNVVIDSINFNIIKKSQDSIKEIDLTDCFLTLSNGVNPLPTNKQLCKRKLKKAAVIQVYRVYMYRPDSFIVQITMLQKEFKKIFFFDIDRSNMMIRQQYSVTYFF